jgi:hypothetical protein
MKHIRKITIIYLLIITILLSTLGTVAIAEEPISLIDESDIILDLNNQPDKASKFLIDIVLAIPKAIMSWLALDDITQLVFMRPTANPNDMIIFDNGNNRISTAIQPSVLPGLLGLPNIVLNPTVPISSAIHGLGINKNKRVIEGRNALEFTRKLKELLKDNSNIYKKNNISFIEFLSSRVEPAFGNFGLYPRNQLEFLTGGTAKGTLLDFTNNNVIVEYKNEKYKLKYAYIPATVNPFAVKDINSLGAVVIAEYGTANTTRGYYDSFVYGIFPEGFYNMINNFRSYLEYFSIIALVLIIIFSGIMLLTKSMNAQALSYGKEIFKGMFIAVLLMRFYFFIFEYISKLNIYLVDIFYAWLDPSERQVSFLDMLYNPNTANIFMALVAFLAVFMIGMMNFQYIVRMLSLGILFAFTPVAAVISVIPERRTAIKTWFSELVGNILTQAIHAAALAFVIKTINIFAQTPALRSKMFWVAMAGLIVLNSLAILVRSLMGLEAFSYNSALGLTANFFGLAPLLAIGRMTARTFGKKKESVSADNGEGTAEAITKDRTDSVSASTGTSTSSGLAYKGSTAFQRALRAAPATAGKVVGGIGMGVAGGLAMAGMGQNPVGGIMVGSTLGSAIGGDVGNQASETAELISAIDKKAKEEDITFQEAARDYFGYYDPSQKYNAAFMGYIGRKVAGTPGELIGNAVGGTLRAVRHFGVKRAKVNTYVNDQNINYMDNLNNVIAEEKNQVAMENQRYETLKSNLDVMGKRLSDGIYSEKYRNLQEEFKNPKLSLHERSRIKHTMDTMNADEKYSSEYYTELSKFKKQELKLTEAKNRLNSAITMKMEASDREEALKRLEILREQYQSTIKK